MISRRYPIQFELAASAVRAATWSYSHGVLVVRNTLLQLRNVVAVLVYAAEGWCHGSVSVQRALHRKALSRSLCAVAQ